MFEIVEEESGKAQILKHYQQDLDARDGAPKLIEKLEHDVSLEDVRELGDGNETAGAKRYQAIGLFYRDNDKPYQAIQVFRALYHRMCLYQIRFGARILKSMPLIWISDLYQQLGFSLHARRYAFLAFCEHVITENGNINKETGGVYFRLAWQFGLAEEEIAEYAQTIFTKWNELQNEAWFPERILLELDTNWIAGFPTTEELFHYVVNPHFVHHLISQLGNSKGKALELLAQYSLSCIPGMRTRRRVKTHSTDLDVVCSVEGLAGDFRDELGRYVICECKDVKKVNFSAIAKFCRVLDSAKCRTGILFSCGGLTGKGKTNNASREQLKVLQDRGIIIFSLSLQEFSEIEKGKNLITLLRSQYESIRLDERKSP